VRRWVTQTVSSAYLEAVTQPPAVPPWRDPLLPPPPPMGTGTSAYVEQPEPQPSAYTIEGEIVMIGRFAQGARRAQGWRGTLARGVVIWWLLGFAVTFGFILVNLFR
jgi:hypothetical protein